MHRHDNSVKDYGTFLIKGNPVIGYGLSNAGGGAATIFSFVDDDEPKRFSKHAVWIWVPTLF